MGKRTSAKWDGDDLIIFWYGADEPDYAGQWETRRGPDGRNGTLHFSGAGEDMVARYYEKPTAEEALFKILSWQMG